MSNLSELVAVRHIPEVGNMVGVPEREIEEARNKQ